MLDQGYLAQIADYIRNRVGEAAGPTFTGGDSAPVGSGPTPMDSTPSSTPGPSYTHLPMSGYKSFETGADVKVLSKVSHKIRKSILYWMGCAKPLQPLIGITPRPYQIKSYLLFTK